MTPDEVRLLDNKYALLFIRGERPVMDEKYDILGHPYVDKTADGRAGAYHHGAATQAVATLGFDLTDDDSIEEIVESKYQYELLSEEDVEEIYKE